VIEAFETISSLAIDTLDQRLGHLDGKETPMAFRGVQERLSQTLNLSAPSASAQEKPSGSPTTDDLEDSLSSLTMLEIEDESVSPVTGLAIENQEGENAILPSHRKKKKRFPTPIFLR